MKTESKQKPELFRKINYFYFNRFNPENDFQLFHAGPKGRKLKNPRLLQAATFPFRDSG